MAGSQLSSSDRHRRVSRWSGAGSGSDKIFPFCVDKICPSRADKIYRFKNLLPRDFNLIRLYSLRKIKGKKSIGVDDRSTAMVDH